MGQGSIQWRCYVCKTYKKKKCSKHAKGAYCISYRIGDLQKKKTIGPSKKEAEKVLTEKISQINNGSFKEIEDILFKDFAQEWFEFYRSTGKVRQNTLRTYRDYIENHFNPFMGNMKLTNITTKHIDTLTSRLFENKNGKKRKAKTVNKIITAFKTMLKFAVRWNYIKINPASDLEKLKEVKKDIDCLSPEEIGVFFDNAREPFKTLFLTAILTGMRLGELQALQWGDIDWRNNKIYVRRTLLKLTTQEMNEMKTDSKWIFSEPKTKYSKRAIVLSPQLKKTLEIHKINSLINEFDLVFTNEQGKPIDQSNMRNREFYPTLQFAGLRKVPFHSLRHSYASLLIAQGENPKFIQHQLGHHSITITMDTYGHLFPDAVEGVGERLDNQIFIDIPYKCVV